MTITMPLRSGRLRALVPLLTAGAFALAALTGCGSDDGAESTTAAGAAATATAAADDLSKVTLRVGDIQSNTQPLFEAAGQDEDLPYRIEWVSFQNGQPAYQALAAGRIDIVGAGSTSAVFAQAAETPIKIVGVLRPHDPRRSNQAILVPKGSSIRSLGDLRGKRIGYFESTPTHYFLLRALDEAKLGLDDVTPVNLPFQQGLSALGSGRIDAWVSMGPFVPIAKTRFDAVELVSGAGISTDQSYIAAREGALEDPAQKAAIADYVARNGAAQRWALEHRQEYAEIAARVKKTPVPIVRAELDLAPPELQPVDERAIADHQKQADRFRRAGVLKAPLDAEAVFAPDVAPTAVKER